MSSLDTAIKILSCFQQDVPQITVSDVAKQLDIPKSTVSRLLKAMAGGGLVEQDPKARFYRVGHLPFRLGRLYQTDIAILSLIESKLSELVEETGFGGYIGVLKGQEIVVLRMYQSRAPLRIILEPGTHLPSFTTALGTVLLARKSDEELRALLPSHLTHPLTDASTPLEQLLIELAQVRKQRWSGNSDVIYPGVSAIGTAVGSDDDQAPVGFSISFPASSVSETLYEELAERIVALGDHIAQKTEDPLWAQWRAAEEA